MRVVGLSSLADDLERLDPQTVPPVALLLERPQSGFVQQRHRALVGLRFCACGNRITKRNRTGVCTECQKRCPQCENPKRPHSEFCGACSKAMRS